MPIPLNAPEVLDREFLEVRAKLLQVAATLDRAARAAGSIAGDSRLSQIQRAIEVLASSDDDRAEQIQMIFSLPYDPTWQKSFFGRQE